jgi:hypothetical protein
VTKETAQDSPYGSMLLRAMQRPDRWRAMYAGTVPQPVVQARRVRNRQARRARRINRK